MAVNTVKAKNKSQKKVNLFAKIEALVKMDSLFENGVPVKYLPYIFYMASIGIFYIGNSHYAEKTIRKIDKVQRAVEDLRADYTTLKADYMFASKQSEVARKVEKMGIYESLKPPFKIIVKEK
jgi:hypothetical protein